MKTKLFAIIAIFFFQHSFLFGQNTLTIVIDGFKNNNGVVLLELKNAKELVVAELSKSIENQKCVITVSNLKEGDYSFKYFHDQNSNKKLDTNLVGMPKEGFGFSNNAKGRFGPPAFKKTLFSVCDSTSQQCTLIYL